MSGHGFTPSPANYFFGRGASYLGERRKLTYGGLGRSYIRNFVRFHACFSAFWNLTDKANESDPIRPLPDLPANSLEGARAPCAPPHPDPPMV